MKKRRLLLLPAVLTLAALWGCAPRGEGPADGAWQIWFSALEDRGALEAVDCELVQLREDRPPVEALMDELLAGPEEPELSSPFPPGTRLLDWSLEEGELHLDLSQPYGALTGVDLTLADACLALTLTQLPQVETIYVTVEGSEIPYRPIQQLTAADVAFPFDPVPTPEGEPSPSPTSGA